MCSAERIDASSQSEKLYLKTSDPAERRRFRAEVVLAHQDRLDRLVRRMVPAPQHRAEAKQAGAIGILLALEKYDPDRGVAFWTFAYWFVREEIRTWMGKGFYWAQMPNRGKSEARQKSRDAARARMVHHSFDEESQVRRAPAQATSFGDREDALIALIDEAKKHTR